MAQRPGQEHPRFPGAWAIILNAEVPDVLANRRCVAYHRPGLWFYAAPDTRLKELIMTDQHSMQPGCLDGARPSHKGVEQ